VRFNAEDPAARRTYAEFDSDSESLVRCLETLLNRAKMPRSLAECGVEQAMIPKLAQEAARQWTAGFNPRAVTSEDFLKLYKTAFEPRDS
jgi:alcohol dehydrogenase